MLDRVLGPNHILFLENPDPLDDEANIRNTYMNVNESSQNNGKDIEEDMMKFIVETPYN